MPSIASANYIINAVDPATTITSTSFTGTIPPPITTVIQDIAFTNTGIVQGQVKTTGATTFPGGIATLYFPCANGVFYCSSANATFGPNGNFTFLTALAGTMQISASVNTAQGGVIQLPGNYNRNNINIPAQQTTQYIFTLPATGNVSGTLTNADGTPAPGITVYAASTTNGIGVHTVTDAAGSYAFMTLPIDTYRIYATDPATQGKVAKTTTLVPDATNVVNLVFLGKNTLLATVRFASGNLAPGMLLSILTSTSPYYSYATAYTDANGQYSFTNIPTGPFTIRAYYGNTGFNSATTGTVTGTGQTQPVAVALTPVGTVSGTLTTSTGTPVAGAYVQIADALSQYSYSAPTDSAGNYAFFPVPADRVVNLYSFLTQQLDRQNHQGRRQQPAGSRRRPDPHRQPPLPRPGQRPGHGPAGQRNSLSQRQRLHLPQECRRSPELQQFHWVQRNRRQRNLL